MAIPMVALLFWFLPKLHILPWEAWFDWAGMYWGMALCAAFTVAAFLFLPCVIAGFFDRVPLRRGYLVAVLCALGAYHVYTALVPSARVDWRICFSMISVVFLLVPYSAGYLLRTFTRRCGPQNDKRP